MKELLFYAVNREYIKYLSMYDSCVTYSTAGNFSAKNYKLSSHDSFLMTQENVYDENEEILVVSKHYIPAEVFELKFSI